MKIVFTSLILLIMTTISSFAELKSPESIIWNDSTNSYLVTDAAQGTIFKLDKSGNLSEFTTGLNQPKGITMGIFDLYVADVNKIVEIDPESGSALNDYPIQGSAALNDIVSDGLGYLYISDTQKNCIYRFDELDGTSQVFATGINSPNGLYYDIMGGLIVVTFTQNHSTIYSVDVQDGNAEALQQTPIGQLDGITFDTQRNVYYISSWQTQSIFTVDPSFLDAPVLLQSGFNGPADIYYDENSDSLAVPVFNEGKVVFINLSATSVNDMAQSAAKLYPNPASDKLYIDLDYPGSINLKIYSAAGALVMEKNCMKDDLKNGLNISNLTNGFYIVNITMGSRQASYKLVKE